MSKERRTFTPDFKRMILELHDSGQRIKDLAEDYSIEASMISRWKREALSDRPSFTGNGNIRLTPQEEEIRQLKRELSELKEERDILKKAVSIFSKSGRKNTSL